MAINRLQPKPKVGDLIYSPYFDDYLEIVEITDDKDWRFKHAGITIKAHTPLSYFSKCVATIVWGPGKYGEK